MKFVFRWGFRLLILLIVLLVAFLLSIDAIARAVVERRLRAETGLDVRIGSLSVGLLSPVVTIENFKLYNKPEFGGSPMLDMPELHLVYDRNELMKRRLRCKLVRVSLAELNLVQSAQGRINCPLMSIAPLPTNSPALKMLASQRVAGFQFLGIDTLNLSVGRITALHMKDPKQVKELNMQLRNRIVTNIESVEALGFQLGFLVLEKKGGVALIDFLTKS